MSCGVINKFKKFGNVCKSLIKPACEGFRQENKSFCYMFRGKKVEKTRRPLQENIIFFFHMMVNVALNKKNLKASL